MKDVAGNELIADACQKVATVIGGYTDELCIAEVIGFTPQKVRLFYKGESFLKYPKQVAIVNIRKEILPPPTGR